ncbi:hypothetical protein FHS16_005825 [Paenibacillus endophyticus]|uniref:Uncharacterized protein n=1 Tax=Paenibacillus endophyticus TaxID=1294268 RepID=A0A7W5CDI3_9BACL|nr:hypothetical protein [Paenibacillus endophyticus]MBB3155717.1 hypothetical protein [Paenibacillus endophyticus]
MVYFKKWMKWAVQCNAFALHDAMHDIALHCTDCIALQCTALQLHCTTLHCFCIARQCIALPCTMLHTALHILRKVRANQKPPLIPTSLVGINGALGYVIM